MLGFLSENLGSIIVGAIVLAVIVLAVLKLIRDKKSISCSCGGCSSCPGFGVCNSEKKEDAGNIKASDIKIKRINYKS